ncbi:MAG: hypothetical protein S4CHLAM37_07790 [Chlamydiia bacterium]|nr:hypothetical protein [Chlamydiia bacterium]
MSTLALAETELNDLSFTTDYLGKLSIEVETNTLYIRSIEQDDLDNFYSLFSDPIVMGKFATGCTKDRDYCAARINRWVNKFRASNPFSGFSVFSKDDLGKRSYAGYAVLGKSVVEGYSEYAIALKKEFWGQGLGSKITNLFISTLAPSIKMRGYKIQDSSFVGVEATAKVDNVASNRMLQGAGMHLKEQIIKYDSIRNHYEKEL